MLRKIRERIQSDERGFTLIELLVVILIIGILAAIALPAFLGQQKKGQDGEAKANARNLVSQVESCFTDTQDYTGCDTAAELPNTGLNVQDGAGIDAGGEVGVSASATSTYTVKAVSKAKEGNAFHEFRIVKGANGVSSRLCTPEGKGGCRADAAAGGDGEW